MKNLGTNENRNNAIEASPRLRENPFSIPEGYFQSLEKDIRFHAQILKSSESVFSVPSNYQEQLSADILVRISEEKIKSSFAQDGFTVPDGYFNDLEKTLTEQTRTQPKISQFRKLKKTWVAYAAAASVALAVSTFAWFQQDQLSTEPEQSIVSMQTLPTDEIINYLAFYTETGDIITLSDQLLDESVDFTETLSTDEIELYLKNSI